MGPSKRSRSIYGTTKAALDRLTQGMAIELFDDNTSVNAIMPARQIWVGGTVYVNQTRDPEGFAKMDLTGKRKDGTIMGDAAAAIIRADHQQYTGNVGTDETALTKLTGVPEFSKYATY